MSAYRELEARFKRIGDVEGALAVLEWDAASMMPAGGSAARAEQIATLRQIAHELLTDARTASLLEEVDASVLDPWQAANVREMRRAHAHATAVPSDLVAALARAASKAEMVWRTARPAADFAALRPHLAEVVRLTREEAAAKGEALGLSRYDALLDGFEPGVRAHDVDLLFAPLIERLPAIVERVLARQSEPLPITGAFPVAQQKALAERLMQELGFDFEHGRLDESAHPFCGGVPDDVRLTTRYEAEPTWTLMAVLHETGHALYNAGLPKAWRRQPVGEPRSTAVHESQSLMVEMQVCRSRAFLEHLAPMIRKTFDRDDAALSADNLYRKAIRVERGLIRVDADEVTYPLHVILRYRLEKALVEGALEVGDLPAVWNEGMAALLGVTPPSDREGCLQDIHWSVGAIGYFPCYTLGALMAAQLYQAAVAAPDIEEGLARGDFQPLLAWLCTNIHDQGCLLETPELLMRATGRPLDAQPFLDHLEARYLA